VGWFSTWITIPKQRKAERKGDRYYNKAACANCPAREKCTPKTPYRTIVRGEFDDYTEEVDAFTKANAKIFAERKCLCEHPFGTVKRAFGFTCFLTRGTENVRTESLLHFLAYNMKRLFNIMETPLKLAEALRARAWKFHVFPQHFLQKYQSSLFFSVFPYIA